MSATVVRINIDSLEAIATNLPGIGKSRAHKIIEYREENGPIQSATALAQITGLGLVSAEMLWEKLIDPTVPNLQKQLNLKHIVGVSLANIAAIGLLAWEAELFHETWSGFRAGQYLFVRLWSAGGMIAFAMLLLLGSLALLVASLSKQVSTTNKWTRYCVRGYTAGVVVYSAMLLLTVLIGIFTLRIPLIIAAIFFLWAVIPTTLFAMQLWVVQKPHWRNYKWFGLLHDLAFAAFGLIGVLFSWAAIDEWVWWQVAINAGGSIVAIIFGISFLWRKNSLVDTLLISGIFNQHAKEPRLSKEQVMYIFNSALPNDYQQKIVFDVLKHKYSLNRILVFVFALILSSFGTIKDWLITTGLDELLLERFVHFLHQTP